MADTSPHAGDDQMTATARDFLAEARAYKQERAADRVALSRLVCAVALYADSGDVAASGWLDDLRAAGEDACRHLAQPRHDDELEDQP